MVHSPQEEIEELKRRVGNLEAERYLTMSLITGAGDMLAGQALDDDKMAVAGYECVKESMLSLVRLNKEGKLQVPFGAHVRQALQLTFSEPALVEMTKLYDWYRHHRKIDQ